MINDNSLGERLNAVKLGKPIPKPPMQPNVSYPQDFQPQPPLWATIASNLIQSSGVAIASLLYGLAIKTIFVLDWGFFGCLAVGFILNHAITVWPRVIKGLFKK